MAVTFKIPLKPRASKVEGFDMSFDVMKDAKVKNWVQSAAKKQSLKEKLLLTTVIAKGRSKSIRDEALRMKVRNGLLPVIAEANMPEEELVLPVNERKRVEASIKDNEWLKMFRQKNAMHDGKRESAMSLS
jgi:hypothetical protein